MRRTPQGVRGLKLQSLLGFFAGESRTPQGVRGLKSCSADKIGKYTNSRTPQGVRGLNCHPHGERQSEARSHPARGAWIEMLSHTPRSSSEDVAPRKGCVD